MEKIHPTETSDPIDILFTEHEQHKELCDTLEEIADSLPNHVDKARALEAARILKSELPLHHRIEETALFPLLVKYAADDDNMTEIVTRLKEDHKVDEDVSRELIVVLEKLGTGLVLENANMIGYMLRRFFESYRRHLIWENNVVLSLARRRLPPKALAQMAAVAATLYEEGV